MMHIFPVDDTYFHRHSMDCECGPYIVEGDKFDAVVHPYFDKREIILAVEIMLGFRCEDCLEFINEKGEHIPEPPPLVE